MRQSNDRVVLHLKPKIIFYVLFVPLIKRIEMFDQPFTFFFYLIISFVFMMARNMSFKELFSINSLIDYD